MIHEPDRPVIGNEGIIYGRYETPDMASHPLTPASETMEWTTEVALPQEASGLYIQLPVETN